MADHRSSEPLSAAATGDSGVGVAWPTADTSVVKSHPMLQPHAMVQFHPMAQPRRSHR